MTTVVIILAVVLVGLVAFRAWWYSGTQSAKRMIRKLKSSK